MRRAFWDGLKFFIGLIVGAAILEVCHQFKWYPERDLAGFVMESPTAIIQNISWAVLVVALGLLLLFSEHLIALWRQRAKRLAIIPVTIVLGMFIIGFGGWYITTLPSLHAPPPAPPQNPQPPTKPSARITSTYDRMNYICDQPQKPAGQDKAEIEQHLRVVAGASGWTPKFTDIDDGVRIEGETS